MDKKETVLEQLEAFKQLQKFSTFAWKKRGLNPSDSSLCEHLEHLFNKCADNLLDGVQSDVSTRQLKNILKHNLRNFKSSNYDTEEREFICDYFLQLSNIVSVNIKDNLNSWLYGIFINTLLKVISFITGQEKVIETLSQDCTKCGSILETFIMRKEDGIPDYAWQIIRCNNCNEYNLLSTGPNIKMLRIGNYKPVEQLQKSEYNEEQARIRLEQIKFFRK